VEQDSGAELKIDQVYSGLQSRAHQKSNESLEQFPHEFLANSESQNTCNVLFTVLPYCHGLKQGINKLSDRCSLLTPTLPSEEEKRRKRQRLTNWR